MYSVETTKRFDKDVKRCLKRGLNIQLVYDAIARTLTLTGFDCGDKERSTHLL